MLVDLNIVHVRRSGSDDEDEYGMNYLGECENVSYCRSEIGPSFSVRWGKYKFKTSIVLRTYYKTWFGCVQGFIQDFELGGENRMVAGII